MNSNDSHRELDDMIVLLTRRASYAKILDELAGRHYVLLGHVPEFAEVRHRGMAVNLGRSADAASVRDKTPSFGNCCPCELVPNYLLRR